MRTFSVRRNISISPRRNRVRSIDSLSSDFDRMDFESCRSCGDEERPRSIQRRSPPLRRRRYSVSQTNRQARRQANRQAGRQSGRQANRQAGRHSRYRQAGRPLGMRREGRRCYDCNERGTKIYCGSKCYLPDASYTRFGTPFECMMKGIGVGKGQERRRRMHVDEEQE